MAALWEDIAGEKRPAAQMVRATSGKLLPEVLIGLGAGAEDDMQTRRSHHELEDEEDHDHDDFESFVLAMPPIADPGALSKALIEAGRDSPILRAKGFLAVQGKPMRLAVQGVGPRIDSYYDRPLREGEANAGHLVIIGLKGLDREAIAAKLWGKLA
jgi:cobalamin biosynthesis protein CobW